MTATRTAAHTSTMRPASRSVSITSSMTPRNCSPTSRNTAFSRTNWIVSQLMPSARRAVPDWITSLREARTTPVTTTARTPEGWAPSIVTFSATTNATNGASTDTEVSTTTSSMRRRAATSTAATSTPITRPPSVATVASKPIRQAVTDPARAAIATRRATRAIASLTRLSPSRMFTSRRGRPIRRATAVAATASGGATMAPRAKPAARGSPGTSHHATTPTTRVENTTNPTDSKAMARLSRRASISDVRSAAA